MNFPPPYNPENCPPPSPGYRYIGRNEVPHDDDETPDRNNHNRWNRYATTMKERRSWTIRRPICIDDEQAPPPEEWVKPGWQVFQENNNNAIEGEEWWSIASKTWCRSIPNCAYGAGAYYRRPLTPMNTVTPPRFLSGELLVDWVSLKDRWPTDAEVKAGLWTFTHCAASPNNGYIQSCKWVNLDAFKNYCGKITHFAPIIWPQPPKNVLPPAPKVNGYEMKYEKGSAIVVFGCANIDVSILKAADEFFHTECDRKGNRFVKGIMLNSDVVLTGVQITEILAYVEAVNKG